jgi:hypothetical protein
LPLDLQKREREFKAEAAAVADAGVVAASQQTADIELP